MRQQRGATQPVECLSCMQVQEVAVQPDGSQQVVNREHTSKK